MTLTTIGYGLSMTVAGFAKLNELQGLMRSNEGVLSGFVATPTTGTRAIAVTDGTALAPGVRVDGSGGSTTVNPGAGPATGTRTDLIVVRFDWATSTTTVAIVPGNSSAVPSVTRTAGTRWEVPRYKVTVRPGVTTIAAADIVSYTPSRPMKVISDSVTLSDGGADPASLDITFPPNFFSSPPQVVMSPTSAIGAGVTQSWSAIGMTASGFTARISKSNTGSSSFNWQASGY